MGLSCLILDSQQAYTWHREFQHSNHGRTPEAGRRPDAPKSGILGGLQRCSGSTPETAGRIPSGTSSLGTAIFIVPPHDAAPANPANAAPEAGLKASGRFQLH